MYRTMFAVISGYQIVLPGFEALACFVVVQGHHRGKTGVGVLH